MSKRLSYTSENILSYALHRSDHQIDAIAGYEFNHYEYYSLSGSREKFDNDQIPYLSAGSRITDSNDGVSAHNLLSFFGRVIYVFLGKYLASVGFGGDGSSR